MHSALGFSRCYAKQKINLTCPYKTLIMSYKDYADIIYEHATNDSFSKKLESIHYNTVLSETEAINRIACQKILQWF